MFPAGKAIDRLTHALDASVLRQSVIANNLANIDVPNFKRSEVRFEALLRRELEGHKSTFAGRRTDPRHLFIGASPQKPVRAEVIVDRRTSMNNNNNNVDIDYEMALMAQNQLYYNTLIQQVNHEIRMTRTAIDKGR